MSLELNASIWNMLQAARQAYASYRLYPRITSGNDGKHKDASLHYKDRAIDLWTGQHWRKPLLTPLQAADIAARLRVLLGPDYKVILEKDHLHVEYDQNGAR